MLEGANHFGIPLRDANKKKSEFKGDDSGPLKGFATDTLFRGRWGANEKKWRSVQWHKWQERAQGQSRMLTFRGNRPI